MKVLFIVLVALLLLACNGGAIATSTHVVAPTKGQPVVESTAVVEPTVTKEAPSATEESPTATEEAPAFVEFQSPDGSVVAEVPGNWAYTSDDSSANVTSHIFSAPDSGGIVQYLVYDDGKTYWTQGEAGKVALSVLNEGYTKGYGDIKISKDQPMPDHSEQLTWSSKAGNYSGITSFKAIGTKLILFSVLYINPAKDQYLETLTYVLSTLRYVE
jgi:hypothetical protein